MSIVIALLVFSVIILFHEFGHGLHGLLTKCNYLGVSGTNVVRDFVELPSQINEHWATEPEVLKMYAKHYQQSHRKDSETKNFQPRFHDYRVAGCRHSRYESA